MSRHTRHDFLLLVVGDDGDPLHDTFVDGRHLIGEGLLGDRGCDHLIVRGLERIGSNNLLLQPLVPIDRNTALVGSGLCRFPIGEVLQQVQTLHRERRNDRFKDVFLRVDEGIVDYRTDDGFLSGDEIERMSVGICTLRKEFDRSALISGLTCLPETIRDDGNRFRQTGNDTTCRTKVHICVSAYS